MQNSNEAYIAVTGSVMTIPTGVILPYGVHADLPAETVEHGLVGDSGVAINGSRSVTNKLAWQNATLVRSVVTESGLTIGLTIIQDNDDNAKLFHGRAKNAVTGGYHWDLSNTGGVMQLVVDAIDESRDRKFRYWAPQAEITEVGEITLASAEFIQYTMTFTCYNTVVEDESCNIVRWDGTAIAPAPAPAPTA